MNNQRGFSLLEVLLVLVCMAAIISWSMHHYQLHQRRAQTLQIESDIKSLQRALDTYFHVTGCEQNGNFAAPLTVACQTLQQYDNDVVCSRPPLILGYQPQVVNTGQTTTGDPSKPIYQLRVQAVIMQDLPLGQVNWYRQQLQAKSENGSYTLTWDSLPSNSYVQLGDKSWILNGSSAFFRATENQRIPSTTPPANSGSFCAN